MFNSGLELNLNTLKAGALQPWRATLEDEIQKLVEDGEIVEVRKHRWVKPR